MEKDKHRSVITVGMLACSMLLLSALFTGCGTCQQTTESSCAHPHEHQTAYYHYWSPQKQLYKWSLTPRPSNDTMQCPWDTTVLVLPDTVKCNDCDSVLLARPFECFHIHQRVYFHCPLCGATWDHPLPDPPNPAQLSAPVSVPCPDPEDCINSPPLGSCPADTIYADSVKCMDCGKVWPPWD
ncbi:hypothetical protein JXD38_02760 [candidate division WOR-3 bacterium]|nr:hypothetical protein [candidate division WOR-3 bacterium]